MTTTSTVVPSICTPWCADGAGHEREHPVDRVCRTQFVDLPMSMLTAVKMSDDIWCHDHVTVLLARNPQDDEAHVVINHDADDLLFTLDEARALRDKLTELLDIADV